MNASRQLPSLLRHSMLKRPGCFITDADNDMPASWQHAWKSMNPHWDVLHVSLSTPCREQAWFRCLEAKIQASPVGAILVATNAGCLAVAHWMANSSQADLVHAALLVDLPSCASSHIDALEAAPEFPFPCLVIHRQGECLTDVSISKMWAYDHQARWVLHPAANSYHERFHWSEGYELLQRLSNFE